jgi:hypothetical protein
MHISIPVLGTTARMATVAYGLHSVPADVVTASLRRHVREEVGPDWYAVVVFDDGKATLRGENEDTPQPPEDILGLMLSCAIRLNKDLHMGGHWIVAFSAERNLHWFWRDEDGDLHASVRTDVPLPELRLYSVDDVVSQAHEALAMAQEHLRRVGIREEHTIKAALGQPSRAAS